MLINDEAIAIFIQVEKVTKLAAFYGMFQTKKKFLELR